MTLTPKHKSLLLGVSLDRNEDCNIERNPEQRAAYSEALERLTIIADDLESDTIELMLHDPEDLIIWLIEHPKATLELGAWFLRFSSPIFEDIAGIERDRLPGEAGVVSFHRTVWVRRLTSGGDQQGWSAEARVA